MKLLLAFAAVTLRQAQGRLFRSRRKGNIRRDLKVTATLLFALSLPLCTSFAQSSSDYPPVPILHTYVLDETNSLTSDQASALNAKLAHYEDSTSTQICIVLIPTLNGYPVEDYAVNVYDTNHIGQKNKNNGALILLAMQDHKGWITTGYGLEPTLTDAATSIIYHEILVPALREGNVYAGLDSATTAMFQIIGGEFKGTGLKRSPYETQRGPSPGGVFFIVIAFFVILFLFRGLAGSASRRTVVGSGGGGSGCLGGFLSGLFWSSLFNTGRGGWGGGGWGGGFGGGGFGSGGGFGGFSGGGGMTGGGGAGGGW